MQFFNFIGRFFRALYDLVASPQGRSKLSDDMARVQTFVPSFIKVIETIDSIIPNKTVEEVIALALKYGQSLPAQAEAWLSDPDVLNKIISLIVFKEAKKLFPFAKDNDINIAIELALKVVKLNS